MTCSPVNEQPRQLRTPPGGTNARQTHVKTEMNTIGTSPITMSVFRKVVVRNGGGKAALNIAETFGRKNKLILSSPDEGNSPPIRWRGPGHPRSSPVARGTGNPAPPPASSLLQYPLCPSKPDAMHDQVECDMNCVILSGGIHRRQEGPVNKEKGGGMTQKN